MPVPPLAPEKIYALQPLRLELDAIDDISSAISYQVAAISPAGVAYAWTGASLSGTSVVVYQVPKDILTPGEWRVQPVPVFAEGEVPGETIRFIVYKRGQ
jgi:hypothetical protein